MEKHIRLTRKVTTRLKLMDFSSDLEALAQFGLSGFRRHRLTQLTRQAYDQGHFSRMKTWPCC